MAPRESFQRSREADEARTARRDLAPDAAEVDAGLLAAVTHDRDHPKSVGSENATGDWRPLAEAPIAGRGRL